MVGNVKQSASRWMEITTSVGCIVDCVYCPQQKFKDAYLKRGSSKLMSLDTFKACLSRIPKDVQIIFSGFCEPFLNPACVEMILHTNEQGYEIQLFTTGVGLKGDDINRMKDIPFVKVCIHLPNDDPGQMHIKVDEGYLGTIRMIFESRLKNSMYMYHKSEYGDESPNSSLQRLAMEFDVEFHPEKLQSRAWNVHSSLVGIPTRKTGSLESCKRISKNVLLQNGDVVLCCMDWSCKHVLGNLLESDYDSLFKSETYAKIVKSLNDDSIDSLCRYCDWSKKILI